MSSLTITSIPFRSSNLAAPPSPFSPCSPVANAVRPKVTRRPASPYGTITEPPKISPLQWKWQCHQCRQTYPLGATRRCLQDGHQFCAGASTVTSRRQGSCKVIKRHKACASEFDYGAWRLLGEWRQECLSPRTPSLQNGKNCWHSCNYPSECRWGRKAAHGSGLLDDMPATPRQLHTGGDAAVHETEQTPTVASTVRLLRVINVTATTAQTFLPPRTKLKSNAVDRLPLSLDTFTILEDADEDRDTDMCGFEDQEQSPILEKAELAMLLSTDLFVRSPRAFR